MARSFEQILAEVTARSDPQRNIVLNQVSQLPTQQAAEESSLSAKKDQAYSDITDGARRKGLGFSGIPLGEQAKYAATEYAPALANLKSTFGNRRSTLESALADIGKTDYTTAYDIFNQDRSFEEQQRQFNEQMAEQRRQAAEARAAQANVAGLFGGGSSGASAPAAQASPTVNPLQQKAYNSIRDLLGTNNSKVIQDSYRAISKSAGYGNEYDKIKLQLLNQMWLGQKQNQNTNKGSTTNLNQLRF